VYHIAVQRLVRAIPIHLRNDSKRHGSSNLISYPEADRYEFPLEPDEPTRVIRTPDKVEKAGVVRLCHGWIRGLISAPLIPAGFRGLRRSPAESGGLKIGRGPCKNNYSGSFSVRRNFLSPELIPECSPGFTGTECHRNPVTGVAIKFLIELII